MPRDSSGVVTLVVGNPVVDDTAITADWANRTLADIAAMLEDSLSRSGSGGMIAAMKFSDGTIGAPGLAFSLEPASGMRRAGASDIRFVVSATDILKLLTTGAKVTGTLETTGALTVDAGGATISAGGLFVTGGITLPTGDLTVTTGKVTASNVWQRATLVSDIVCNDTTPIDVTGITFACATATKYLVRAFLIVNANVNTSGLGFSAKNTGSPTHSTAYFVQEHWNTGVLYETQPQDFNDTPAVFTDTFAQSPTIQVDRFTGYFVTTSTGTFQLLFRSEVASPVTVKAGSYLEYCTV